MAEAEGGKSTDLFLLTWHNNDSFESDWFNSKRDALFQFRSLVNNGRRRVKMVRYRFPTLPASASPRQIALFTLRTLGCSERTHQLVRVEAFDPGGEAWLSEESL